MTWDEVKELAPLYAIGALDEETALAVEVSLQDATPDEQTRFIAAVPFALRMVLKLLGGRAHGTYRTRLYGVSA